jgi:excisionase family DNA binding protein
MCKTKINDSSKGNLTSENRLLKVEEVAKIPNISRSFAYQLIQAGAIPVDQLGRVHRARRQDVSDSWKGDIQ